jgi:large subunit ribosomal protein L32e
MMIKMNKLKLRLKIKRKKPEFIRKRGKIYKRLGLKWRSPRGVHSQLRRHKREAGNIPKSGYSSPKEVRGLHPSGFEEVLIYNVKNLEKINPTKQACRIASTIGKKKRIEIMKKAEYMKIKILNPFKEKKEAEKK